MALLPGMGDTGAYRESQNAFGGYNHNLSVGGREFYDARNLSLRHYPVLASRAARARVRAFAKFHGMCAKGGLIWADGTGLYCAGEYVGQVADSNKQFATMGARVLIWPDKKCYDTVAGTLSDLGARVEISSASFALSRLDGDAYGNVTASDTAPSSPSNGAFWVDTSGSAHALKVYSASMGAWSTVGTTYVKISAAALGTTFKQYDGVTITGVVNEQFTRLGTDYVVMSAGAGWICVVGVLDAGFTASGIVIERRVPDLDFIVQSGNRLWGCSGAKHEIYASKLGDPTNWYCYQGLSTDSYAATVGSEGDFTGACEHLGYVLFFKEDCVHKVFGSRPSNFQIAQSRVQGVKAGAAATLAEAENTLLYLSPYAVCGYDGGLPKRMGDALGSDVFTGGAAGALDSRYFVSLSDAAGDWHLFSLDLRTGLWMREDDARAVAFAREGTELYFVDAAGVLWAMNGTLDQRYVDAEAAAESPVTWMAETGDVGTDSPDNGYIGRVQLRLEVDAGGWVEVWVRYDSAGAWRKLDRIGPTVKRGWTIEAAPFRCDHFRLRIKGAGGARLYSMARVREEGTELGGKA